MSARDGIGHRGFLDHGGDLQCAVEDGLSYVHPGGFVGAVSNSSLVIFVFIVFLVVFFVVLGDASVAFPVGRRVEVFQIGDGVVDLDEVEGSSGKDMLHLRLSKRS